MKRVRIYLDTNIIYDIFQKKTLFSIYKKEYSTIKKIEFLENHLDKIIPATSFFTLIEVALRLQKDFNLKSEHILQDFRFFRRRYKIKLIDTIKLTGDILQWILKGLSWKDAIQLNIAKNKNMLFVTEDKELLKFAQKMNIENTNFKNLRSLVLRDFK